MKVRKIPLSMPVVCTRGIRKCLNCRESLADCKCGRHQFPEGLVACDEALLCQRCGMCMYHCECLPPPPPPKPRRKRGETSADQIELCEKPELYSKFPPSSDVDAPGKGKRKT